MSTKHHLHIDVSGVLKMSPERFKQSFQGVATGENGRVLSVDELRRYFEEAQAKGWRVVPMGDCQGFDYQTGCPGHVQNDDPRAELARKLKQLRKSRGVSLRDLAAATAISNPYLSQLETGKIQNPGVFTLLKLAEYYEVKLEWLVAPKNPNVT